MSHTGGGAIDIPPSMSTRSSMFIAGSITIMKRAITGGAIDCFSSVCSASRSAPDDRPAERRHHPLLLAQLVLEVGGGEAGQLQVQAMGHGLAVGRCGVDQRRHEDTQRRHAVLDRQVLGLDDHGEVGGVEFDEHLDEVVLVVMMEFEQLDQLGALLRHVGDRFEVGDVERARVHRRVEHREADGLVDLAVEVVGQHPVGEVDGLAG